jgi:hypothetical protein
MTSCSCCRNLEKPYKPCNPHLHISRPHWPGLDYKVSLAARLIYCKDDLAILFIYIYLLSRLGVCRDYGCSPLMWPTPRLFQL